MHIYNKKRVYMHPPTHTAHMHTHVHIMTHAQRNLRSYELISSVSCLKGYTPAQPRLLDIPNSFTAEFSNALHTNLYELTYVTSLI